MYLVTYGKVCFFLVLIALFTSIPTFYAALYFHHANDPVVMVDGNGKCVSVRNINNGDAFVCADRDVLLRIYKVESNVAK